MEPDCLGQCAFQSITDSVSHWDKFSLNFLFPFFTQVLMVTKDS